MGRLVTGSELKEGTVALSVPHGDLLAQLAVTLARWGAEIERLEAEMDGLRQAGIFADKGGRPVVPQWWERKEDGRHAGHYLLWPAEYAKRAGRKQREFVKAARYQAAREKVWRTVSYVSYRDQRDALLAKTKEVGQRLSALAQELAAWSAPKQDVDTPTVKS